MQPGIKSVGVTGVARRRVNKTLNQAPKWLGSGPRNFHLNRPDIPNTYALSFARQGRGDKVAVTNAMSKALRGSAGDTWTTDAREAVLHEQVHTRQKPLLPSWRKEAGAEVIARKLIKRETGSPAPYTDRYTPEIQQFYGKYGQDNAFRRAKKDLSKPRQK